MKSSIRFLALLLSMLLIGIHSANSNGFKECLTAGLSGEVPIDGAWLSIANRRFEPASRIEWIDQIPKSGVQNFDFRHPNRTVDRNTLLRDMQYVVERKIAADDRKLTVVIAGLGDSSGELLDIPALLFLAIKKNGEKPKNWGIEIDAIDINPYILESGKEYFLNDFPPQKWPGLKLRTHQADLFDVLQVQTALQDVVGVDYIINRHVSHFPLTLDENHVLITLRENGEKGDKKSFLSALRLLLPMRNLLFLAGKNNPSGPGTRYVTGGHTGLRFQQKKRNILVPPGTKIVGDPMASIVELVEYSKVPGIRFDGIYNNLYKSDK